MIAFLEFRNNSLILQINSEVNACSVEFLTFCYCAIIIIEYIKKLQTNTIGSV